MIRTNEGRNIDRSRVDFSAVFDGPKLGHLNMRSGFFTATRTGSSVLRIRAALKGAPAIHAVADVSVRVTETGNSTSPTDRN